VIDTVKPGAPVISSASLTNDTTPVVSGTAEVGATITAVIAGATYTTTATEGSWTIDTGSAEVVSGALSVTANGTNSVSVTATDAAGNVSAAGTQTLTVDTQAPTVTITDNASSTTNGDITFTMTFSEAVSGFAASDITVANGTAGTFTQTGEATYTLVVTPATNTAGNVTVDIAGAIATDAAGNSNTAATQATQLIDTAAPSAPTIDSISTPDNDNTPTISITAETGSTVKVYSNGDLLGTATQGGDAGGGNSTFTLTPSAIADGNYSITATARILLAMRV